jgi:drug/metabolite transporter (DMT)-like permease
MSLIDFSDSLQAWRIAAGNKAASRTKHLPLTGKISGATSGLLAGIASAACSGGMIFAIHGCAGLVSSSEITFIRAVSTVIVLFPFVSAKGDSFLSPAGFVIWFRSSIGAVSVLSIAWNLQHTSVGFAYTLFNFAPLLVILFGAWLGHEALDRNKTLTILLVVLASAVFWYASRFETGPAVWIVGLSGMCAAAGAYALLKSIPNVFSAIDVTWALSFATIPVALIVKRGPWLLPTGRAAVLVGVICTLSMVSNILANVSFRILPLSMATAIVPSAIIWGVMLDMFHHDFPPVHGAFGCLLYLLATIRFATKRRTSTASALAAIPARSTN